MCKWTWLWCMFLGSLLLPIEGVVELNELQLLSEKLRKNECWALANFLAQNSYDPIEAAADMTKEGGRSVGFNCFPALDFWRSKLLPLTIQNSKKNETFGDEILDRGLRLISRPDLVLELNKIRSDKISEVIPEEMDVLPEAEGNSLEDEENPIQDWGGELIGQEDDKTQENNEMLKFFLEGHVNEDTAPLTSNESRRQTEPHRITNISFHIIENYSDKNQQIIKYGILAVFTMIGLLMMVGSILVCIRIREHANARLLIQPTPVQSSPTLLHNLQAIDAMTNQQKDISAVSSATGDSVDSNANDEPVTTNNNTEPEPGVSNNPGQTPV